MKRKIIYLLMVALLSILALSPISIYGESYDTYRIFYEGKNTGLSGFYVKGTPYLPLEVISKYGMNNDIKIDENNMRLTIDLSTQRIMMADEETTALVKNYAGTIYIPLKKLNDIVVFPLNTTDQFLKLGYTITKDQIKLHAYNATEKIARINNSNVVAVGSLSNTNDEKLLLNQNERIYITGESENYYVFNDFDGESYYVLKDNVIIEDIDLSKIDYYAPKKQKFVQDKNTKINLAWQYVSNVTPEAPASNDGIDILAPTWFRLIVEDGGNVTNSGDRGYTEICHQNGYLVWATITNNMSEKGSTNFTTKMFSTPDIMKKAIAQYIFYSCLYDVDGINIDFEDVRDDDANGLTAFTKEMRYYTERQGLNLSIDTLIPKPWTIEYDRDALSKYVDYLAIMTYDEHYSSSKTPGSIASLPWVEEAVQETLKEGVPKEKLLMGVPLYTRVWVVDSSGTIQSAGAATMENMQNILKSNNAPITYLSKEKQNYAEYPSGANTAKVWIEDETSITNRLYLVKSYDLAGSACWQYSQATNDIWYLFDKYLH